ncbi:MAG: phosphoribosyltransferase [Candidatus Thorarchaeota archaeon]|nr:phosphoribosyltransferase [Candidatus Thorarchaeota archaeon]
MVLLGHPVSNHQAFCDMKYLILSWQDVYNLTLQLSERIVESGYKPTVIVGIARGGWIPARILSDVLYANTMWNVRIEYYTDLGKRGREPRITQPLLVPLEGQSVLVVDEVADTGESLFHAIEHIKAQRVQEVRSAVLHLKETSRVIPDYYMQKVDAWTVYPWEVRESLIALVKKFKTDDPSLDLKQIRDKLVFEVGFEPTVADYFIKRL